MRRFIVGLPRDALAGLLLVAIAIPEQLATARLAGMPPEAGLVTFIAGAIGFAVFGTNRFLSAGADSTIAPIFAGGLAMIAVAGSPHYAALAALLSVMAGAVLIGVALLRAGWVADLLSIPVTAGFMAGVAVHIIVGQLPSVLALPEVPGPLGAQLLHLLRHLPEANPVALAIGVFVLAMAMVSERLFRHLPTTLLALVAVSAAWAIFHLDRYGIGTLGALSPLRPVIALAVPQANDVVRLAPLALIVALVCMMQTAAVLRTYPSQPGGPRHVARDFGGIGAGCILAGLFGGFPVNASPPRTALVVSAGGGSKVVSVVAVMLTVALLAGAGWLFAFVPHPALGGILIAVALRIFRLNEIVGIARRGGSEIWLVVASALLVIGLPIETGMLASIVLSLLHSFYAVARPLCVELARAPGTTVWWPAQAEAGETEPGVLVFAPAAPLNFTNAAFIRARLMGAVERAAVPVRLVVIEASGVTGIDYTGAAMLRDLVAVLRERGVGVALARLSAERAQEEAERSGVVAAVGAGQVFQTVEEAVRRWRGIPAAT